MPTTLVLVRHGETDWNRVKRIQGHIDIPLSETGASQASRLAQRLEREMREEGASFDAIVSSDLVRAMQTAEPSAQALGKTIDTRPAWREREYGAFQGLDSSQIADRMPDAYAQWQTRDPGFVPPGDGESYRVFYHRIVHALEALLDTYRHRRVLCVTHGGVLDCVRRFVMRLPLDAPRNYPLLNASLNELRFDVEQGEIVRWGDIGHLTGQAHDDSLEVARP
jgi:2,3-bisphosphoglycerate-dependent phosphoglycerate mutase